MICFETERLIAKSEMIIANGKLLERRTVSSAIDILKPNDMTNLESTFLFYNIKDKNERICHIEIVRKRDRFEVSYGTVEKFRGQGFMKEALSHLITWIFSNTEEEEIWGLPNGPESEHILKSNGFLFYEPFENNPSMKWYRITKANSI